MIACVLVATSLRAQPDPGAQALFDEGRTLLLAHRTVEACDKFEQSQRRERALGTLLNLADCYQQIGRTASAWRAFSEAADWAHERHELERETVARTRVAQLAAQLARITIDAPDRPELVIELAGAAVPATSWRQPMAFDPGSYHVSARISGTTVWTRSVDAVPGATTVVHVPVGQAERSGPAERPTSHRLATGLFVAAGASLVVSAALGGYAWYETDHATSSCHGNYEGRPICSSDGVAMLTRARWSANIATAMAAASVIAASAGGVIVWRARSGEQRWIAPQIEPTSIGASVGGGF